MSQPPITVNFQDEWFFVKMLKCLILNYGLTGISPNMLDYGSMEKLSLNWPQSNIQGPLSKTDSGYHCANPLKCNPVTSPYCVFILHHLSWIRLFLKTFNMFFEDFFNEKKNNLEISFFSKLLVWKQLVRTSKGWKLTENVIIINDRKDLWEDNIEVKT